MPEAREPRSGRTGRRGNREGTVSHRRDGRWEARISTADGRRRVAYARTREDASVALQRLQREAVSGLPVPPERLTVRAFMTGWVEGKEAKLRPSTATRYRQLVVAQIVPTWGRLRLARLSPQDVDSGLARLQEGGLSPRTCSHVLAVLRAALHDARRWGLLAQNVAQLASPPRVPRQEPHLLSPADVGSILDSLTDDPQLRRLATVAVHAGLRQGELLGLRWQDVDAEAAELHVTQALQRVEGAYRLVEVKSASSRRSVPLTPDARDALEDQRRWQLEAKLAAGGRWREPIPGLVFTTDRGQPINGPALTHGFERALATAALPVIRWHHLRHGFAGLLLASGADLASVSHLLGHSSVALTASTYAGIAPSLRRDAVARLGAILQRPG